MIEVPTQARKAPALSGLLAMAAGFGLAWLACAHVPRLFWAEDIPVFRRQQLPIYAIYDPALAGQPKHAFVGSSYIINDWVANDLDKKGWPEIEDQQSSYSSLAHMVADREFGVHGQGFYEMGRPGPGFLDHIWYIEHCLEAPNIKTIIYANGYSGMYHFEETPWSDVQRGCLEAQFILERWKVRYPGAAPAIERYLGLIRASKARRQALERFGPDWRSRMDTVSVLLPDRLSWLATHYEFLARHWDATGIGVRGNPHMAVNKPAEMRDALIWRLSWLARLGTAAREKQTMGLLDRAAGFYDDSRLDAPVSLNPPTYPFGGREADADIAWIEMIGQVLRQAHVRLVWFFPPEVSIRPSVYEDVYRPQVVDAVRRILEPMGHLVSDHVVNHDLNQRDFLVQQYSDPPFGYGYKQTVIGKLKATRLLLADLSRAGVIQGLPGPHPSCWPGEARLPRVRLCVKPYPPTGLDACLPWPEARP
jgi:hypothetical protein